MEEECPQEKENCRVVRIELEETWEISRKEEWATISNKK